MFVSVTNVLYSHLICTLGRNILRHNYVFWLGDFNFRIDMPSDEVKSLVRRGDWAAMYKV